MSEQLNRIVAFFSAHRRCALFVTKGCECCAAPLDFRSRSELLTTIFILVKVANKSMLPKKENGSHVVILVTTTRCSVVICFLYLLFITAINSNKVF